MLGTNHRLSLFNMARIFIWIKETKQRIIEFYIGYMINPILNITKEFREQVNKSMNTTFGEITKSHNRTTLAKNDTRVLA